MRIAAKGNRPSFTDAADPAIARRLLRDFAELARNDSFTVATGEFRRHDGRGACEPRALYGGAGYGCALKGGGSDQRAPGTISCGAVAAVSLRPPPDRDWKVVQSMSPGW